MHCRKTFSVQTFRQDYRDHRPELNPRLLDLLASGTGLRQSARILGLTRRNLQLKARKIGRHCRGLNANLLERVRCPGRAEAGSFEALVIAPRTRPAIVSLLLDPESLFVFWAEASWPGSARKGTRRGSDGGRQDAMGRLPSINALGPVVHAGHRGSGGRASSSGSAVARTERLARDLTGRLRCHSWLVSKRRRWLDLALHVFLAWRNLVRRAINAAPPSPAMRVGLTMRRWKTSEVLSWRQTDGARSVDPLTPYPTAA